MYVILVTVYTDAYTIASRRIWNGRIFDSFEEAFEISQSILIDGDISLMVKRVVT